MKKNEPYLQMPVKETFLYGRLISGKSLGDVIYIKARRKYCFRLLLVFESGDVKMVQRTTSSNKQLARQERDEALMEIANGSFIPFSYTVKEFYDFWFYHHMLVKKGSLIIPIQRLPEYHRKLFCFLNSAIKSWMRCREETW